MYFELRDPVFGPEFIKKGVLLDKFQKYPIPAGSYDAVQVKEFLDRRGNPVQVVRLVPHRHQMEPVETYRLAGNIYQRSRCSVCGMFDEVIIGHYAVDEAPEAPRQNTLRYEVQFVPEHLVGDFLLVADQDEMEMADTGSHLVPAYFKVAVYDSYGNLMAHGKGPDEATARRRADDMLADGLDE